MCWWGWSDVFDPDEKLSVPSFYGEVDPPTVEEERYAEGF